ncbi:MAG TPA: lysylphosphatidylglycerol synthase domain-containing protein [Oxalicibacterium sp.]|nr:lysylphosphatidylglycerol synthase domain-containing protein [Oxalicibacterium sp.]
MSGLSSSAGRARQAEATAREEEHGTSLWRRSWPWLKRIVQTAFFLVVAWLIVTQARTIAWDEVFEAMRRQSPQWLWLAILPTVASHALYSCFDLLGRHLTRHGLAWPTVMFINFISYAFNINLGSLIGAAMLRYRLYARHGLETDAIARIIGTSIFTNWFDYLALAGAVFLVSPLQLPPQWKIGGAGLHVLGAALLSTALAYLAICAFFSERRLSFRGHVVTIQRLRFALLQLAMSCANWMLMACVIYLLLERQIAYTDVLCVLLIAVVAGVIVHVPAGLGVVEAVFVALLSYRLAASELLAALLTYRFLYYLVPLVPAALGWLAIEVRTRGENKRRKNTRHD